MIINFILSEKLWTMGWKEGIIPVVRVLTELVKTKNDTGENTMQKVKYLGRAWEQNGVIWMGLSGTGVEFTFTGKKLEVTFLGDSRAAEETEQPFWDKGRVAVEIDGERTHCFCMDEKEKKLVIIESEAPETRNVRILKISEAAMSVVGISDIQGDADSSIVPAEDKKYRMEVIGDSITCGYGIDDPCGEHAFATKTEDATKAYAYKAAQLLGWDYSLVSYSGYGIVSGYTGEGILNTRETLPQYYEKVGYSVSTLPDGEKVQDISWDFSRFTPDVIVINLGTNDDSYCLDKPERQAEYSRLYVEFLKIVRAKNPAADIICILGLMGDRLYPFLQDAVGTYKEQTGDRHVRCVHVEPQKEEDGYSADFHPSVKSQKRLAEQLCREISER